MRVQGQQILLSASDLMRFMSCKHATALDLRYARGEPLQPAADSEDAKILQKYGDEHEARYLEALKTEGRSVIEFDRSTDLAEAARETREALRLGADVLFQAAFLNKSWGGWSDFLIRSDKPSSLGTFSYEVVDTKLKRKPDPKHILQLILYSDLLASVQGCEPEEAHIELGNGERFSFRTREYAAYARQARGRLEQFIKSPAPTTPDPVRMCDLCRWRDLCKEEWEASDSLVLVAGISRSQRSKLLDAGIDTMAGLAQRTQRIPRLSNDTLMKLSTQARLQSHSRAGNPPSFELKPYVADKGFALLPEPNGGDLFYDIEGDPLFEGGLEYLHGVWFNEGSRKGVFRDFWAHDRSSEGEALRKLFSFFVERLEAYPGAHIYHYAGYEISALRRLTMQHGIGEEFFDQLLRENRFVDLYRVVTSALFASEPSYSLKALEAFYMEERGGEVKTAGGSVVAYENWRGTGDPKFLKEICEYNKTDCISTQGFRDWLVSSPRPAGIPWRKIGARELRFDSARVDEAQAAADELRRSLESVAATYGQGIADLLLDLNHFHRRERKPVWWSIFDKIGKDADELIEDMDCIGGLRSASSAICLGKSWECEYQFPEQEAKLDDGPCHVELDGAPQAVMLIKLDRPTRSARVRFPTNKFSCAPDETSLLPGGPLHTDAIESAIECVTKSLISGDRRFPAVRELLLRSGPSFRSTSRNAPIVVRPDRLVDDIVRAVNDLDCGVLPIQGPPGTGKTYLSSCAILDLVRQGKRVAVTSHSHKAIDNLLFAVLDRAAEATFSITVAKKGGGDFPESYFERIYQTESNNDDYLHQASIVGATAWLFARADFKTSFDYLFVDEAGQVSLANAVAMGTCADNIVLVGDPMQLSQPIQGAHPGLSGSSSLEYLLSGHQTVPAEKGIFLPISRRMRPEICRFISDLVYEGRLTNHAETERQHLLSAPGLPAAGAYLIEVSHTGNSQSSEEEASALREIFDSYIGQTFVDRDGIERSIGLNDILVVAPYNLQVNLLKHVLPLNARVGTVDKFQGQEAPICLVSMTSSSAEEMPRGIEFLFSLNRINVAISRAQVLSLVFASPHLLEIPCSSINQMRLVNCLCALKEYGEGVKDGSGQQQLQRV